MINLEMLAQEILQEIQPSIRDSFFPAYKELQEAIHHQRGSAHIVSCQSALEEAYTEIWDGYIHKTCQNPEAALTLVKNFCDISQVFEGIRLAVRYAQEERIESQRLAEEQLEIGVKYLMTRLPK